MIATLEYTEILDSLSATPKGIDKHMQQFWTKAVYLYESLGSWSTDYFVVETVKALRRSVMTRKDHFLDAVTDTKCQILRRLNSLGLDLSDQDDFGGKVPFLSPKA